MYIPEFLCGVVATLLFEFALCMVIAVVNVLKEGGNDEEA